jgi:hypothetical protein
MQNISDAAIFADSAIAVSKSEERSGSFTLDTTFVLFFLAMEMGQTSFGINVESLLSGFTLAAFLILPYFLPFSGYGNEFLKWFIGRFTVAAAGVMFGLVLGQATGTLLPDTFRFVPMSLLIVAAIICCNIQLYGILRDRLAR